MSDWMLQLARDWSQPPEMNPVTELSVIEYDEDDEVGMHGEVRMSIQTSQGRFRDFSFKMNRETFRFFVDSIAGRYHAGGP